MDRPTITLNNLRSHFWDRKWRRRATIAFGVLVALVFTAWLLLESFLIPKAARRIEHELAKLGIHISYQDPDLSLLRGSLTLADVVLYRTSEKHERLLSVSDFGFRIDLAELIWKQALWGEGSIENGQIVVYGKERDLQFQELAAAIEVDSEHLTIVRFDSVTNIGLNLDLRGGIRWGGTTRATPSAPQAPSNQSSPDLTSSEQSAQSVDSSAGSDEFPDCPLEFGWLEEVARIFSCAPYGGELADLSLELTWDETRPARRSSDGSTVSNHQMSLTGQIAGRDVVWQNVPLEIWEASFGVEDWMVSIPGLKFVGLDGKTTATGNYDLNAHRLAISKLHSSMDPIEVVRRLDPTFAEPLKKFDYDQSPSLSGENVMIDFQDLQASEIVLQLVAPMGIRYRDIPGEGEFLNLSPLRATVAYGDAPELRIRDIVTSINGLDIEADVTLQKETPATTTRPVAQPSDSPPASEAAGLPPTATRAPATDTKTTAAEPFSLVRTLNNLLTVEFDHDQPPLLEVEIVSGPQGSVDPIDISGSFTGSEFSWHGRLVEGAEMNFGFTGSQLDVSRVHLTGLGGHLDASGSYDLDSKVIVIPELSSTIDIDTLRRNLAIEIPGPIESIEFPAPPEVTISMLRLELGDSPTGRGRIEINADQGLVVSEGEESLATERFGLIMDWKEPQALAIESATGRVHDLDFDLTGSLRWRKPEGVAVRTRRPAQSDVDEIPRATPVKPQRATPTAERRILAEIKKYLTFTAAADPVRLEGSVDWDQTRSQPGEPAGDGWKKQLQVEATISGRDFSWLEFPAKRSDGRVRLEDGVLRFLPFHLATAEGSIESTASFEIGERRMRIDSLHLTIDPVVTLKRFGVMVEEADWIEFRGNPVITGKNIFLDFADMANSSGELQKLDRSGIALTPPGGRTAVLENVRGTLLIGKGRFRAQEVRAEFLGGAAILDFEISPLLDKPAYSAEAAIQNISLDALNDWLNPDNRLIDEGTFNLTFSGTGSDSLQSLVGNGRATIGADSAAAQGFPLVSGLVSFLEGLYPILSRNRSWELDLPFTVAAGKIESEVGRLTGRRISANLSGSVDLVNSRIDLLAGVNLKGLIGIATSVATPLRDDFIEVVGRGSFENPQWARRRTVERRERREQREQPAPDGADTPPTRRPRIFNRRR